MKVTDIKKMISNAIEVNQLVNQTNRIKLLARDGMMPILDKLAKVHDGKLLSDTGKGITKGMERYNRKVKATKFFGSLLIGCEVIAREAETLEKSLDSDNFEYIMRESLDIKQAHIIQFITIADFYLEYARTLSSIIQEAEVATLRGVDLDSASRKYLNNNLTDEKLSGMATIMGYFIDKQKEDIVESIYELPEIKVDDKIINTIQSTEGVKKIDPAGFNPFNIINPTFWAFTAQKSWSEIKLYRMELGEKELEQLELRHQELLLLKDGRNNPDLERKIDKYQDRIQVLRTKVKRIKDKLG